MRIRVRQGRNNLLNSPLGRKIMRLYILLGILLILIGFIGTVYYCRMAAADAAIDRIEKTEGSYDVYISYTYGANDYEDIRLGYWDSNMEIGKRISIRIHPDAPGKPISNAPLFLLATGVIFTSLGLFIQGSVRLLQAKEA